MRLLGNLIKKNSNEKISNSDFLSFIFIFALTLQQYFLFIYDSKNLSFPPYLLIGYLICHIVGLYNIGLGINNIYSSFIKKNIFLVLFFIYLIFVILFTADFNVLVGNLFYKDGLFHWFFIGLELHFILQNIIKSKYDKSKNFLIPNIKKFLLVLFILYLGYGFFFMHQFSYDLGMTFADPGYPLYQRMSENILVNSVTIFSIVSIIDDNKNFSMLKANLFSLSLILSFINYFSSSTAILVYFFIFFICATLPFNIRNFKLFIKYIVIASLYLSLFVLLYYLSHINIEWNEMIPPNTIARSRSLYSFDLEAFGPISSRFKILLSFFSQFKVSPLFGGWHPEIKSGMGAGNFIHSLPFSLITHTGILGFILFAFSFIRIIKFKLNFISFKNLQVNSFLINQLIMIFLVASLKSFFVFYPFWFLMGLNSTIILKFESRKNLLK